MSKPGRLLLLSTDMGMGGGAEEQVIRLAYAFKARGWATLIVSMLPPSRMPSEFESRRIPLVDLGMRRGLPDPRALFRLTRIVREFMPDIVHSHMVHANLLARAARLIHPYPALVCTQHNLTMAGVDHNWTALFELGHRLTDVFAERGTAISRSAADYYVRRRAVSASKMAVIPNGIDCERYLRDHGARHRLRREFAVGNDFVWLAVGRLEQAKAYPTMLRAFARLGEGGRRLLICGQGSQRETLKGLASDLGVGDRVSFLGLRDDIPAVMSASDAFALSSDLEGLPLVLIQASAAGLPIVATDVGGNAEVVDSGESGYLVPSRDSERFSQEMARLEGMEAAERLAVGRKGQARVHDYFDAERVMEMWVKLYAGLLEGNPASRPRRFARAPEPRIGDPLHMNPCLLQGADRENDDAT